MGSKMLLQDYYIIGKEMHREIRYLSEKSTFVKNNVKLFKRFPTLEEAEKHIKKLPKSRIFLIFKETYIFESVKEFVRGEE